MFFPFHDDNPTQRFPAVTCALIAINVLAFVYLSRLPEQKQQELAYRRGFVPARIDQLVDPHPKPILVPLAPQLVRHPAFGFPVPVQQQMPLEPDRREVAASLITCMFLHGGWFHLIGNMWFLWIFGNNVEDRLGPLPFVLLYLVGGLLASGCHWLTNPNSLAPVIGASGAVATILGAYAITWPWARVRTLVFLFIFITIIDLPALLVLGVWFVGQLLAGTREGAMAQGVAWWAHVGGFLAGTLLMPAAASLIPPPRKKLGRVIPMND